MAEGVIGLELRSTVTGAGLLRLDLVEVTLAPPAADEVIVRVEATPINPSDLGLLLGPADMATVRAGGTPAAPTLTAAIPERAMAAMRTRLDQSLPVGNEGAGTVVAAGADAAHLLGHTVAMFGGGMYTQVRKLPARDCIVLPAGASAADGAAMFVNPLTALAFVETMRAQGHRAIVHTAAASNLGQMLHRICLADGVALINIVRGGAQAELLRGLGAVHVLDSTAPDFDIALVDAIAVTGATVAFDAIGGGALVSRILHAMEVAASRDAGAYSRYGSATFKQAYIYGALDPGPTLIDRGFGFSWGVSGWLLTPFLQGAGADTVARLRGRVTAELRTTFASHYTATISLADALRPEIVAAYQRKATGEKFLIDPSRAL